MFIHQSLIFSSEVPLSLRSRVINFFKRFLQTKDMKHGMWLCPLSVLLLQEVLSHKRQGPSDQRMRNNSQAPHIHCRAIIVGTQEEFWGCIMWEGEAATIGV